MGKGDGAQDTDLHDISAYLMNTVELIEREPCTEAAALHATATAFSFGQGRPKDGLERRDRRVLRKAFLRLHKKVASARPGDNAREMQ
jgi:hypothetical protein